MNPIALSQRVKTSFAVIRLAALVAAALLAWGLAIHADSEMSADLLAQSRQLAQSIKVADIQALTGTPADLEKPEYLSIKQQLASARLAFDPYRCIYLIGRKTTYNAAQPPEQGQTGMAQEQADFFVFADSESEQSKDYSPPGRLYTERPAVLRRVFGSEVATLASPRTDHGGNGISALTPLIDPHSGGLLGVLGMDRSTSGWYWTVASRSILPVGLVFGLLIALASAVETKGDQGKTAQQGAPRLVPQNRYVDWIVLVCSLITFSVLALSLKSSADTTMEQLFNGRCDKIKLAVSARLEDHAGILLAGAGLFRVSEDVSREEWRDFINQQKIHNRFPGIQGVGFSQLIPWSELDKHIQSVRKEGFDAYTVRPAGSRNFYTSIVYLEPFSDRNLRAFGYDMFTEPVRRAAMEKARDTDMPTLSGKVVLVQETANNIQAGTLMYVPVYKRGMPLDTVEQRRAATSGWVYSPCRMDDLLRGVLSAPMESDTRGVHLKVFAGGRPLPENLLHDSDNTGQENGTSSARFTRQCALDFNGRQWTLLFTEKGGGLFTAAYTNVRITLWTGTLISLLLFGLIRVLLQTRARAQRIAEKLTIELKEREESYRNQFTNNVMVMVLVDPADGRILDANAAALRFYGYPREQFLGMRITDINTSSATEVRRRMDSITSGQGAYFEFQHRLADGSLRDVAVSSSNIQFGGGTVIHSIIQDTTEINLAKKLLKDSEYRWKFAVEGSGDGLWDWDVPTSTVFFSKRWKEMLGYSVNEIGNGLDEWEKRVHPDDKARTMADVQAHLDGTTDVNVQDHRLST